MVLHVLFEQVVLPEPAAAHVAPERFLRVGRVLPHHVIGQAETVLERFGAHLALEVVRILVDTHVLVQAALFAELPRAAHGKALRSVVGVFVVYL